MVSIPEKMFVYRLSGSEILPVFLTPADRPWLRRLLDEVDRSMAERVRVVEQRLSEIDLGPVPDGLRSMAKTVLLSLLRTDAGGAPKPREVRACLFGLAARSPSRRAAIERAAADLSLAPAEIEDRLFTDLPAERRVLGLEDGLTPEDLALRTNLAFVQGLLFRSTAVRLAFEGNARAIIRSAKLGGLLCTIIDDPHRSGTAIEISGPFSLFRRTLLYGRALSRIVPFLAWARRFELHAECEVRGRMLDLHLASPAPIFPSREPRRFDSQNEERFARRFARLAPDWELLREPEPVRAGRTLIFPDFLARHRHDPLRRTWIEIVGFWSPEYLQKKLARLREADLPNLILCVDDDLACGEEEPPRHAQVLRFKKRLDPQAVLNVLDGTSGGSRPPRIAERQS